MNIGVHRVKGGDDIFRSLGRHNNEFLNLSTGFCTICFISCHCFPGVISFSDICRFFLWCVSIWNSNLILVMIFDPEILQMFERNSVNASIKNAKSPANSNISFRKNSSEDVGYNSPHRYYSAFVRFRRILNS